MTVTVQVQVNKLDSTAADFQQQLRTLLAFEAETDDAIETAVAKILADVYTASGLLAATWPD